MDDDRTLLQKVRGALVLAALGDALGYHRGQWEFNDDAAAIHADCDAKHGGVLGIVPAGDAWIVSDDTVQLMATGRAVAQHARQLVLEVSVADAGADVVAQAMIALARAALARQMAAEHVESWSDMTSRAPGSRCRQGIYLLKDGAAWNELPEDNAGTCGCGAAMRSSVVGLAFRHERHLPLLVVVAADSARLSHNSPAGVVSAVIPAALASFALQNVPPDQWPARLVRRVLPLVAAYYARDGRANQARVAEALAVAAAAWTECFPPAGDGERCRLTPYVHGDTPAGRDRAYHNAFNLPAWSQLSDVNKQVGGGWDAWSAPLLAYDALARAMAPATGGALPQEGTGGPHAAWAAFLRRGALHGGDSDSTGAIGGAWLGALLGEEAAPRVQRDAVEKRAELDALAAALCA